MMLFGEQFARGPLRDPISAIVGGATSIIGGIFGHKTANDAAKLQAEAAAKAGQQVTDAAAKVNPDILAAAAKAGTRVTDTAGDVSGKVNAAADRAATGVTDAAGKAATGVSDAATGANKLLDPYSTAGATAADLLAKGITPGGDFNKVPTMADIQIDPGYDFRLQQGLKAQERSAAAHGAVGGGGFQKDLQNYVQGSASQEFDKAFNRFRQTTQDRFGNLSTVANAGRDASTTMGRNLIDSSVYGGNINTDAAKFAGTTRLGGEEFGGGMNFDASKFAGTADINAADLTSKNTLDAARSSADYLTQAANARAAGKVAGSNALWGGIGGAAAPLTYGISNFRSPAANYINPGYSNLGPFQTPPFVGARP